MVTERPRLAGRKLPTANPSQQLRSEVAKAGIFPFFRQNSTCTTFPVFSDITRISRISVRKRQKVHFWAYSFTGGIEKGSFPVSMVVGLFRDFFGKNAFWAYIGGSSDFDGGRFWGQKTDLETPS